jgi:hypothetical protein
MALIESVFKRDADNRTMSFQNIAEETRLPLDEVEHLVMKALRYFLLPTSCLIILNDVFLVTQPEIDPWLVRSSRREGPDYLGATACPFARADRAAIWQTFGLGW